VPQIKNEEKSLKKIIKKQKQKLKRENRTPFGATLSLFWRAMTNAGVDFRREEYRENRS
jgi:hypothetical protein